MQRTLENIELPLNDLESKITIMAYYIFVIYILF